MICVAVAMPKAAVAFDQLAGEAASCRVVEAAARASRVPVSVLTRLLWYESGFQVGAVSRVGAQGIAQFMPATADERGLWDPFNLNLAIPQAASLLADLEQRFGNIGLAIAAYNAGPGRIAAWLDRKGDLPRETERFVLAVTGRSPEEWETFGSYLSLPFAEPRSCLELRGILGSARINDLYPDRSHLMPAIGQSGRLLPSIQQSGKLLPELQQSGRLLQDFARSGRRLQ